MRSLFLILHIVFCALALVIGLGMGLDVVDYYQGWKQFYYARFSDLSRNNVETEDNDNDNAKYRSNSGSSTTSSSSDEQMPQGSDLRHMSATEARQRQRDRQTQRKRRPKEGTQFRVYDQGGLRMFLAVAMFLLCFSFMLWHLQLFWFQMGWIKTPPLFV